MLSNICKKNRYHPSTNPTITEKARFPMHDIKMTMALSRLRLPRHNKIHGCKQLLLPTLDQTIGSNS